MGRISAIESKGETIRRRLYPSLAAAAVYLFRAREAVLPVLVLQEEDRHADTANDDEQGETGDPALGEVTLEHVVLVVASLAGGRARDAARAGGGHLGGGLLDDLGEHSDPRGEEAYGGGRTTLETKTDWKCATARISYFSFDFLDLLIRMEESIYAHFIKTHLSRN